MSTKEFVLSIEGLGGGDWVSLTKPGIVAGNLITALGGALLAGGGTVAPGALLAILAGVALVVASGCVCNNVIDRDIDGRMARTRERVLASGRLAPGPALTYAALLGAAGLSLLAWQGGLLSGALGALGWGVYVGVYSLWLKRRSVHATLVGSLAGAMPPVIGYCAVAGRWDGAAWLLLLAFCLWQLPHSHAIAILRLDDYRSAGIPVLPRVRGTAAAQAAIVGQIPAFTLAAAGLGWMGYAGAGYLAVTLLAGAAWWLSALSGWRSEPPVRWARRQFLGSILVVVALSTMLALDARGAPLAAWLGG